MGTSHPLNLNSFMQTSVLKEMGWKSHAVSLAPQDFINTEQDLERVLRKILNVDDCVELSLSDAEIDRMLPIRTRALPHILYRLELAIRRQALLVSEKQHVLRKAILEAYDTLCAVIFARIVEGKCSEVLSSMNNIGGMV